MGQKKAFTEKQVERLRHMKREEGLRNWEIANAMGVTTSTVSRYLRRTDDSGSKPLNAAGPQEASTTGRLANFENG